MFGCCNCGSNLEVDSPTCKHCGGYVCKEACLKEHECDPDGDM